MFKIIKKSVYFIVKVAVKFNFISKVFYIQFDYLIRLSFNLINTVIVFNSLYYHCIKSTIIKFLIHTIKINDNFNLNVIISVSVTIMVK